jgi:nucleoside-diphosphate-sugar epimerase
MNILVTGAAGLIGTELCAQLVEQGHKVFAVDNMSRSNKIPKCHEFYCEDLSDSLEFLKPIQESIDLIYHLSAINGTSNFYERPNEVLSNNIKSDLNIFKFAKKCSNLKKFFYASSSEIMSHTNFCNESNSIVIDDISNPRYSYKISKLASENYLHNSNLPWIIVRYFNVYGPETKSGHFVYDQIQNHKNKIFKIIGFNETRCYTYVEDAVDATIKISDKLPIKNTINIGSLEELTSFEATKIISESMGYFFVDYELLPGLKGSPRKRKPNLTKLLKYYSEYSPITFQKGIKKVLDKNEKSK